MSDALGFGSGKITTLLTAGAPIANNTCNTMFMPDYYFAASEYLMQCK